jgi:uncharacterized repeat protein (TIGR03803 family)
MANQRKHSVSTLGPVLRTGTMLLLGMAVLVSICASHAAEAQTFTVLHSFTGGSDGGYPYTGLTLDRSGNLFGTAAYGAYQEGDCQPVSGCGTVFELAHQGTGFIFHLLYQFHGFSPTGDGMTPIGRVIFGPDGALYGTTYGGGSNIQNCTGFELSGCGTVFRLAPPPTPCRSVTCTWDETKLFNFAAIPYGLGPSGEIAFDSAGNLYGTTQAGGPGANAGTVYELTPAQGSWTFTLLHAFERDSGGPVHGVQLDPLGNVYGTTAMGGNGGVGTAFQLVPSGSDWTLNTLYQFQNDSGGFAPTGLIVGPGGNLYGSTTNGSPNPVVFEFSPSNGSFTYSTLYTFGTEHCCGPYGNLVMDSAGNLYGAAAGDSAAGIYGNVFKLTASGDGWTYTDLYDFTNGDDGAYPEGGVVLDANGNLYGTAESGGAHGAGTVWEITP